MKVLKNQQLFLREVLMSKIDLTILGDPDNRLFFQEIRSVHEKMETHQPGLFRTLLGNFEKDISEQAGNELLIALCKILSNPIHTSAFIRGRSAERLPYSKREFSDRLFDLLYILALNCPTAFTAPVAKLFSKMIRVNPYKSLYIIGLFAKQFDNVDDPWPMLDLLFKYESHFKQLEVVENYLTLLVFLCCQFPYYRKARAAACWNTMSNILEHEDTNTVSCAYYSLCRILEISEEFAGAFPRERVLVHINNADTKSAVLSFLLRYQLPTNSREAKPLVTELLKCISDKRAAYILLKMAKTETIAKLLISRSQWMADLASAPEQTVKLFTMIMSHSNLRSMLLGREETIDFLRALVESGYPDSVSTLCCLIRRMPLSPSFVQKLSTGGVVAAAAANVVSKNDKLSALLLYDTLGRVAFISDFVDVCAFVVAEIKQQDDNVLSVTALTVACMLASYQECANELVRLKILKFFRTTNVDPSLQKQAKRLLRKLAPAVDHV